MVPAFLQSGGTELTGSLPAPSLLPTGILLAGMQVASGSCDGPSGETPATPLGHWWGHSCAILACGGLWHDFPLGALQAALVYPRVQTALLRPCEVPRSHGVSAFVP